MSNNPVSAGGAILREVRDLAGTGFALEEMTSRAWSSSTFRGERHKLAFRIENDDAGADRVLSKIEARELGGFPLRGHLLADLELVASTRRPGSARIEIEALTVEDA